MLVGILKNLLILGVIGIVLFGITRYVPILKKQTGTQFAKVLGAKTSPQDTSQSMSDALSKDAKNQLDQVKKTALHINLSDILQEVDRLRKIPQDLSAVGRGVTDFASKVASKK